MKKSKLEQLYSTFLLLPFPLSDGDRNVMNWIEELTEVDAFYAGIAESLIMHKPIESKELPLIKPLSLALSKLKRKEEINEERYNEYKLYLSSLDKLAKEISKQVKELDAPVS
ncbi:MAG: hypothetical protein ACH350_02190 [Parachlamydiaceae bacterium]